MDAPQCATAVFDGGPSSLAGFSTSFLAETFTSMFCSNERTEVRVFQSATNSIISSGPPSSSSSTSSVTDGAGGNGGLSQDPGGSTPSTSSNAASPTGQNRSKEPTPVGAIAGATV